MIISKCKNCGVNIENKYPSIIRQFCSQQCANEFNNAKRLGVPRVEYIEVICEQCGKKKEVSINDKKANRFCSRKCMGLSNSKRTIEICLNCGKEFETRINKCCSDKCSREYRKNSGSMKKNGFWFENGYKVLYVEGNNSIKEHIKVVEENIGRKLNKNELVHHINENRLDNRLENLKLMTRGEHSSYHRKSEIEKGKHLFNR